MTFKMKKFMLGTCPTLPERGPWSTLRACGKVRMIPEVGVTLIAKWCAAIKIHSLTLKTGRRYY